MALFKRKAPSARTRQTPPPERSPICLALQGGGAHGAFQWGILDRLLEADRLDIRAISASSAGAMNAVALISGLATGGPEGARRTLDVFWREVNLQGGKNVFGDTAIWSSALSPDWLKATPMWRGAEDFVASFSPYELNPFNLNPLRRVLDTAIDFDAVRASDIRLFVAATQVRQSKVRLFQTGEIAPDVLLASACLPHLFQAVTIDGEPYWDGGYMANPALWPLIQGETPDDILLLTLNPFNRAELPRSNADIIDRLNEISFNAPLVTELRAIAFVHDLLDQGRLTLAEDHRYRRTRIHAIEADGHLDDLSLRSKSDTEWSFLTRLKDRGRAAADEWLDACLTDVGERASVDLQSRFV